jgi:WD40 repeat protein
VRSFDAGDRGETISAFSPDGRYILTAGSRNSLSLHEAVLWEAATGKRVQSFRGPTDAIRSLAFNDDGQQLKVDYELGWTATWDLSDGKPVHEMGQAVVDQEQDRSETWPNEYTSADGRWKVSRAKDNDVVLIDMHSSKTTTILHYPSYKPIKAAFSTKSPRVAVADGYSVHVFNPETGKELATLISAYGGRDWLVTTPSNYFDGSRGGQSLIRWRVGEAVYPEVALGKAVASSRFGCQDSPGKAGTLIHRPGHSTTAAISVPQLAFAGRRPSVRQCCETSP